ncbi:MAG: radical SAM protein [Candidatus Schekmanbacteria bacterium]|nr:radical SAM protein [Candidatus Schekmanbacteria bacterium]
MLDHPPRPRGIALVFPPLWYYTSIPADLAYTGAFLEAKGIPVSYWDLSAGFTHAMVGDLPGFAALRRREHYLDSAEHGTATADIAARIGLIAAAHQIRYRYRTLRLRGIDDAHLASFLPAALDARRNPALRYLESMLDRILATEPRIIAVACVHPDQIPQALAAAALLRRKEHRGWVVMYGSLEDVVAPDHFLEDLVGLPAHAAFDLFDGVVIGEAETALAALYDGVTAGRPYATVPNLLAPAVGLSGIPERHTEDLPSFPTPTFSGFAPDIYPYPEPVIDLRLSRGCPWGKCVFCAIQAHHPQYRAHRPETVAAAMLNAWNRFGSRFFRIRDDLLTRRQFLEVAEAVSRLPFSPRWSARARFEASLTADVLARAASAGLEELWMGLESGSERVRSLMKKGVETRIVERILADAVRLGIRVRALCMVGFPGETAAEARQTLAFLAAHASELTSFSLTPFMLMTRNEIAAAPEAFGLCVREDGRPRRYRMRYKLEVTGAELMSAAEIAEVYEEAAKSLLPPAEDRVGPDLAHDWIRASVQARGWGNGGRDLE